MSKVSRSVNISAPTEAVFAYYARPEHIAKTFPEDTKMKVVPINVTEGFGLLLWKRRASDLIQILNSRMEFEEKT